MAYRRGDDDDTAMVGALLLADEMDHVRATGQIAVAWAKSQQKRRRRR
jgi:hypothetical protein